MKRLLRELNPFGGWIALTSAMVLLSSVMQLGLSAIIGYVVDSGLTPRNEAAIQVGMVAILSATLVALIASLVSCYGSARVSVFFGQRLRRLIFERVSDFSQQEMDAFGTPSLVVRTTNDVNQVAMTAMMVLRMMITAPLMLLGGMVMALITDWKIGGAVLLISPLLMLAFFLVARKCIPMYDAIQRKLDKLNQVLREGLTGIRVIRAFNQTGYEQRRFDKANEDLTATALKVNRIMAAINPLGMLVFNLTTLLILWAGGVRIGEGTFLVGKLIAMCNYVAMILSAMLTASIMFVMVPRAQVSANRITETLDTQPSIQDGPAAAVRPQGPAGLAFHDVTFAYPGSSAPSLEHLDFVTRPGETTAIIGSTGSGKSTLIHLAERFYEATEGRVCLDGQDIREMPLEKLRHRLALIPQQAFLFAGTIADNLRHGYPEATEEQLWRALRIAQAADFVQALPEGLDAPVTQGGTNYSGGQRQRLCIARALVRPCDYYLFDDSFSALDFRTDARLRQALRRELGHAGVLLVAQRVGTVMNADRILVLEEGRLVGMGRHEELLKTCSVYREIVQSQLQGEEAAS